MAPPADTTETTASVVRSVEKLMFRSTMHGSTRSPGPFNERRGFAGPPRDGGAGSWIVPASADPGRRLANSAAAYMRGAITYVVQAGLTKYHPLRNAFPQTS